MHAEIYVDFDYEKKIYKNTYVYVAALMLIYNACNVYNDPF